MQMKNNNIALIAQGQAISGKGLVYQEGMKPYRLETDPFRIIDNKPVFYSGANKFDLDFDFNKKRLHKWGTFYHPYILFPDNGGSNTVYVETSVDGWYLMLIRSKLDEWNFGPGCQAIDIVAWTPKSKGDSIREAGFRMFYGVVLAMDDVPIGEDYSEIFEPGDWDDWSASTSCFQVFASIRKTNYESSDDLIKTISDAPDFLKKHILAMKSM